MADMQQMLNSLQDPTDIIFMSPDLTEEDRNMSKAIFDANKKKIKSMLKREGLFSDIKEAELVDKLSKGIKAILSHNLRKRTAQNG